MLDSFKNDPPIFRHLIFPSFDWKDLIASKWKFTLASEICILSIVIDLLYKVVINNGFPGSARFCKGVFADFKKLR